MGFKLPPFSKPVYVLIISTAVLMAGVYLRLAVLTMFLRDYVNLPDSTTRQVYHSQHLVGRLIAPLFGVLADNYIGAFWQYFICQWALILTPATFVILSIRPWVDDVIHRLHFICIGTLVFNSLAGYASLPCYTPFTADQFEDGDQKDGLLSRFFTYDLWFTDTGCLIGTLIGPVLRQQIHCFGQPFCFTAPFVGYLTCLLVANVILTVVAVRGQFNIKPPSKKNQFLKVVAMIPYALYKKSKATEKRDHWMDYADDKYDKELIEDAKELRIIYMLMTGIFFFVGYFLYETTWILQAARMNGEITEFVDIPPDSTGLVVLLGNIILLPTLDYFIYPAFAKRNMLTKLHQKMLLGYFFYIAAYICSCLMFFRIETEDFIPPKPSQLFISVYNPHDCSLRLRASFLDEPPDIGSMSYESFKIALDDIDTELKITGSCGEMKDKEAIISEVNGGKSIGIYFKANGELVQFAGDLSKNSQGYPSVFHVSEINGTTCSYRVNGQSEVLSRNEINCDDPKRLPLFKAHYDFEIGEQVLVENKKLYPGAVYAVLVRETAPGKYEGEILEVVPRNSIHMLWLIPQYLLYCCGTVIFSVAYSEFSYKQAPKSMKMFVQGFKLTVLCLSEVVIIIVSVYEFTRNSYTTLVYIGIVSLGPVALFLASRKYKYREDAPASGGDG